MKVAMRREKTGHTWLWARVYGVVGPMFVVGGFTGFFGSFFPGPLHSGYPGVFWLLIVLGAPSLALGMSLNAFRFPYSVFGRLRRTPLPASPPFLELRRSRRSVGKYRVPAAALSWYVWPEGIGFAGVGEGFVPKERVQRVELRREDGRIFHGSPEVRSPLVVPREVAELAADIDSVPAGNPITGGEVRTKAHRRDLVPILAFLALFVAVGAFVAATDLQSGRARAEIRRFLREAGSDVELLVDGNHLPGPASAVILGRLRDLGTLPPHHSHPMRRFSVLLIDGERTLELDMGRDSRRPDEYWVYFPRDWMTDHNAVGRIRTNALDSVPSSGKGRPRGDWD